MFGLGYVGCVTAACLANEGHDVRGFDIDKIKIDMIKNKQSPIIEEGLEEIISKAVISQRLSTSTNGVANLRGAEISLVCVGTPSRENGGLELKYISKVAEQIGKFIRKIDYYHVVCIRSTVLPGTVEDFIIPILEKVSGKKAGEDFGVVMNPEFLREGSSINDFYNPPFTIIGELDKKSGDLVAKMYEGINDKIIRTSLKSAEMIKYASNAFHALKVVFSNEIGNFCKKLDIDSHDVMNIFSMDDQLNISDKYLKPGFAFGGSCLPKDLRSLMYKSKEMDLSSPLLNSILESNEGQIENAFNMIKKTGKKSVGILGLSFKEGTDDLRESPLVELIEKLIGKGYDVSIYDEEVYLAKLIGSNKRFLEQSIPHVSSLLKSNIETVIDESDVIVVGKSMKSIYDLLSKVDKHKHIIDLVRINTNGNHWKASYEGICW